MSKRVFLIDGLSQIFRCYYAPFRALTSPTGEPTRATYVFTNMLLQMIRQQKPDYLAMVMDSAEAPVFRKTVDAAYKAHREAPPEDLAPQIARILEIIRSQDIPVLSVPGFEADDLLATIARMLAGQDVDVLMVSKDKDLDQVLTDRVKLFDPSKGEIIGPDELEKLKGYRPAQAVEVQTLCGDSTDNVPGVKGVGPKKAAALIAKYGTADNVIAHADELTPAMRENVKAFAAQAATTRELVTLRCDVPVEFDLEACRWTGLKPERLQPIMAELGFRRLAEQFAETPDSGSDANGSGATDSRADHKPRDTTNTTANTRERQKNTRERENAHGLESVGVRSNRTPSSYDDAPLFASLDSSVNPSEPGSVNPVAAAAAAAAPRKGTGFIEPGLDKTSPSDQRIVPRSARPPGRATNRDYVLVDSPSKLDAFLADLKRQPCFAFDTETTSLNPVAARLAGLSFSWKAGTGYYLAICGIGDCLELAATLEALRPIMADPNVRKVGQNMKYDLVVMRCHGVEVAGVDFDTMIASFVLDSSRMGRDLDSLAAEFLGIEKIRITELIGKASGQTTFDNVETYRQCEYSAEDADATWQLAGIFREQLKTGTQLVSGTSTTAQGASSGLGGPPPTEVGEPMLPVAHQSSAPPRLKTWATQPESTTLRCSASCVPVSLETLFRETEMPLVEVLAAMECEGVRVDTALLARMGEELGRKLDELRGQIHEAVGFKFNIDSPKQLAEVLFDQLKLPVIRKTKTGRSTDAETLDRLAFETAHPVPQRVKEYRELVKLKGTYVDTLPRMILPRTGRIHAGFNQTSAITGRLSSSDPNLQNIPIRTEVGRRIREAFVARDADHVLLTADYSQIELRVLAHFCGDAALRLAFAEDRDIHQFVAAQVFNVPLEEVTREQRGRAKAVNFGIIYGQTAFGLSRTTGMAVGEAENFIRMYFMRYPGIRMFIDSTIERARQIGYVTTILGRRRAVSEINSRNKGLRAQAERLAVNTVIQGSAADLIKRAMINIHRRILAEQRPSRMIIQVHDELVFDVPRTAVEAEADFVRHEMTTALPLDVPIKVDLAWGENWLDSK